MNKTDQFLIQSANQSGKINPITVAGIISHDEPSFWEFFANNNPAGILGLYKQAGSTGLSAHPHPENVYPILKKLLDTGNYTELCYLLNNVPYNANANNVTTLPAIWQQWNITPGNFYQVFATYFPTKIPGANGGTPSPAPASAQGTTIEIR